MTRQASSFVRTFEAGPTTELRLDEHYLLCATEGVLRLAADGREWTVPPARAALIAAGRPIAVTIVQRLVSASVLFDVGFVPAPTSALSVFDLTPLARELVLECRTWDRDDQPLPARGEAMFRALAEVVWDLAERPIPTSMPTGRSAEVQAALRTTGEQLGDELRIDDVAGAVGLHPRSLARRFQDELGMTWGQARRRLRILRAVELLADDAPVTQVAFAVGYGSMSAFNAAFRDLIGQSPSEHRASSRPTRLGPARSGSATNGSE